MTNEIREPLPTPAPQTLKNRCYPDAMNELKTRTGREHSVGAIYITLDRLEAKGFVRSKEGEATARRGGRRKLLFSLTALGRRALQESLNATDALRVGTIVAPVLP
jgi:PadR family transcriptional regulator PadR